MSRIDDAIVLADFLDFASDWDRDVLALGLGAFVIFVLLLMFVGAVWRHHRRKSADTRAIEREIAATRTYRPDQIELQRFAVRARGYDRHEVEAFLSSVAHDYECLLREKESRVQE